MFNFNLHQDESGQNALETAIILIAFIVVASVFAFTILSAGSASTEKGEEAIYAGLEGVQSSMYVKGAIIGTDGDPSIPVPDAGSPDGEVDTIVFTLALLSGGDPVDLTEAKDDMTGLNKVVIGYRDEQTFKNEVGWTLAWVGTNDGDQLLEEGELAEITVSLTANTITLGANKSFTLEVKPPTGAILSVNRTTPAAIEAVMELR